MALRIPNEEVKSVFGDTVKKWFEEKIAAGYDVRTNSEQGIGRADIVVKDQARRRAIVIEVKWFGRGGPGLEKECAGALKQIEERQYRRNLQQEGYTTVLCYGAAFQGKTCLIRTFG